MTISRFSCNGGEISPSLYWRGDIDKYSSSCKLLENFLIRPQGTASTRWGSETMARLNGYDNYRIISFPITSDTYYDLIIVNADEDEESICQVWQDDKYITSVSMPYTSNEIDDINYFQSYDVIFLFHPNHPVQKLSRISENEFELQNHEFRGGPFDSQNLDTSTILSVDANQWSASAEYNTGDIVSLGDTYTIVGNSSLIYTYTESDIWRGHVNVTDYYNTVVKLSPSPVTLKAGDNLTIDSITELNGDWTVVSVNLDDDTVQLNTGTKSVLVDPGTDYEVNWFENLDVDGDTAYANAQKFTFYTSLIDNNVGQDPTTITSAWVDSDYVKGTHTISSSVSGVFSTTDVGRKIKIGNVVSNSDRGNWDVSAEGSYTKILPAYGTVTLKTEGGIWDGEVVLQQTTNGGASWEDIGVIESYNGTGNGIITREITTFGTLIRGYLRERNTATNDSGCIYYLDVYGNQYTYFTIRSVISDKQVTASVDNYMWSWVSNYNWALGTFCDTNGYPSTGTLFEERLVVGGVPTRPMNIWMSGINDFEDFIISVSDLSSVSFSLPSSIRQSIKWMLPKQELIIGTDGGEWTLGARGLDQAISASNVRAKQHTSVGSEPIPAIASKDQIIFVERNGNSLRGMGYDFAQEGYVTTDLSILASHLTQNYKIKKIVYSTGEIPIVWCLLEDGNLLTFSYERNENVNAWARQDLGGTVKSICVAPNNDVNIIVERDNVHFFEKIIEGNYHIDSYREIDAVSGQIYPLYGNDRDVWNSSWQFEEENLFGDGYIIKTAGTYDINIKQNDQILTEDVDYMKVVGIEGFTYWLPTSGEYQLFNTASGAEMISGIDYNGYDVTSGVTIEIYDYIVGNIDITKDSVYLERGTDYFTNGNIIFIPNTNVDDDLLIEENSTIDPLENNKDFEILPGMKFYACIPSKEGIKRFGIPQTSYLVTTDYFASPNMGGPGSNTRASELEIYAWDSIGGEFRFEDLESGYEQDWIPVNDMEYDTIPGEALEPYTGMRIVSIDSGHQRQGLFLEVKSDNPQHFNLAHTAVRAVKYK